MKNVLIAGIIMTFAVLISGCLGSDLSGSSTYRPDVVRNGSRVSVNYWLTVDGKQIDTSEGGDLFTFTIGNGEVIPGFEKAVTGMTVGDTKEVVLTGKDAYTTGPLAGKELHFKIQLVSINE